MAQSNSNDVNILEYIIIKNYSTEASQRIKYNIFVIFFFVLLLRKIKFVKMKMKSPWCCRLLKPP